MGTCRPLLQVQCENINRLNLAQVFFNSIKMQFFFHVKQACAHSQLLFRARPFMFAFAGQYTDQPIIIARLLAQWRKT